MYKVAQTIINNPKMKEANPFSANLFKLVVFR